MIIFKGVFHDAVNNTLEALWIAEQFDADGSLLGYENSKSRNYSIEQKAQFEADIGADAAAYIAMAGW